MNDKKVPRPTGTMAPILSARALGVLLHIVLTGENISAEGLAKSVVEGERAVGTALRELVNAGFVATSRVQLSNGRWITSNKITEAGYLFVNNLFIQFDVGGIHGVNLIWALPPGYKSGLENVLPAVIYHAPLEKMAHQEEPATLGPKARMSTGEDQATYSKVQQKKVIRRFQARENKLKKDWTSTDVSFEFSDRLQQHWHIAPWRVTKTRFARILADNRRRYETNGEIECLMIDRFMETEEIHRLSDPNQIAKRFIYRFSELEAYARSVVSPTAEKMKEERDKAMKEWEKF